MGNKGVQDAMFNAMIESSNITYVAYPAGAAPTAAVSDNAAAAWALSAYVQIVAAAVVPNPCWIVGVLCHTGVVETWNGEVVIAQGAAAAEVVAVEVPIVAGVPTAVGVSVATPMMLPYPVKLVGQPRLAVAIRKSTAASLAGVSVKLLIASNIGS